MKRLNTTLSKNLLLKKQKLQTDCPKETKEAPNETRVDINLSTPSEVPQETARNSKIVGTPQKEVRNQKPDLQNTKENEPVNPILITSSEKISKGFTVHIKEEIDQTKVCWSEKWKPKESRELVGNTAAITKAKQWLEQYKNNTSNVKPVLVLCGPCGVGKSILLYILAEEVGYEVEEYSTISGTTKINNKSNFIKEAVLISRNKNTYDKKPILILIDQADVIGNATHYSNLADQLIAERGDKEYKTKTKKKGTEVIKVSVKKKRPAPIILTVNEFNEKLNPLKKKGKQIGKSKSDFLLIELVYLNQLYPAEITKRLQYICTKEKIAPVCLDLISESCNGDMRRAITMLELACTFLGSREKLQTRIIGILKCEISAAEEKIKSLIKESIITLQKKVEEEQINYIISGFEIALKLKWNRFSKSGKYECSEKDRAIGGALEYLRQLLQPEKREMVAFEVDRVCTLFKPMEFNPRVEKTVEKLFENKMSIDVMKEEVDFCANRSLLLALVPENAHRALATSKFKTEEDYIKALNNLSESLSMADLIKTTLLDPVAEDTSQTFQEVYELFSFQLPIFYSKGSSQMVKLPKLEKEQHRCVSWQHMSSYENTFRETSSMLTQIQQTDLPQVARIFANFISSWNVRPSEKDDEKKYCKRLMYGENLDEHENSIIHQLRRWTRLFDIISRDDLGNLLKEPHFKHKITDESFHLENTTLLLLFFRNQKMENLLKKQKKAATKKPLDLDKDDDETALISKEFKERKKDYAKILVSLGFSSKIYKKMKTFCLEDCESYQLWTDWVPAFDKSFESLLEKAWKDASDVGNLVK